jgi:predicted RNA-binding Zn-ribbon protein involved in translation (DUF1610 family)
MKCDILIHLPSGVAFTGRSDEDKFIGSPAIWFGERKKDIEVTSAQDSLILTWKEGKAFEQRKLPYASMTHIGFGGRKETEVVSNEARVAGALVGAGWVSLALAGTVEFGHVRTLVMKTRDDDYELYLSQASDWAERLRTKTGLDISELPDTAASESISLKSRKVMVLCPRCGQPISRAASRCERCGESMEKVGLGSLPTIQKLIDTGKIKQCQSCGAWMPLAGETCRCGASLTEK